MSTTALTTTSPMPVVESATGDMSMSATTPIEMQQCQLGLIEWCKRKITATKADAEDLNAAYESAKAKKWKTSTLQRHAGLAVKRVQYYEKMLGALEHGFIIVPNFPVTLFAIRTDKDKPLKLMSTKSWDNREQQADCLPTGEGDYKNPAPIVFERKIPEEGKPDQKQYWAEKFDDIDFPINMAKPHIMEATDNAMALKIFDEFGILPSPYRKKDPLIVGRIRDPQAPKYDRDGVITFIVSWFLDTRTL